MNNPRKLAPLALGLTGSSYRVVLAHRIQAWTDQMRRAAAALTLHTHPRVTTRRTIATRFVGGSVEP